MILIKTIDTNMYYVILFTKGSHRLGLEVYIILINGCLLDDKYIELIHMRNWYGEIISFYGKTHVIVA